MLHLIEILNLDLRFSTFDPLILALTVFYVSLDPSNCLEKCSEIIILSDKDLQSTKLDDVRSETKKYKSLLKMVKDLQGGGEKCAIIERS